MSDRLFATDFAVNDYPVYDADYPLEHFPMYYMSQDEPVHAFMWLAAGSEARGCVIIPPQKNGGDNYESLITPLISSGIHVMKIHPRGMWGHVPSTNTLGSTIDDIHAAVEFLRSNGGEHQGHAARKRRYWVDPDRIGLIGKSGGGGVAGFIAAAENAHLNSVVALSPVNLDPFRGMPDFINHGVGGDTEKAIMEFFASDKELTGGRVDHAFQYSRMTPADFDRVSILQRAGELIDKNILLVGASADAGYLAATHKPLVEAMGTVGARNFTDVILQGDSYFLTARIALARLVIDWYREQGF